MRCVSCVHGQDGYRLRVTEVSLWALAINWLLEATAEALEWMTRRCIFCETPAWTWRVGYGKVNPEDDDAYLYDPGEKRHSLAGWLMGCCRFLHCYDLRREQVVLTLPMTPDQALDAFPEWRDSVVDDLEDDSELPVLDSEPGHDASRVTRRDLKRSKNKILL